MHARTALDIYAEVCEEDKTELGDEQRSGKLKESMYGTRAASHDWQAEVTRTMKELWFRKANHHRVCSCTGKDTKTHLHRG